ncbi:hypothetical protein Murru_3152 [Allomuricauda ruestringensis DSM 13258]|uniref:Uncharacterized protein n=1 Tax=Allomuricauda ruestringensis (strain DSM 13258 / CIP 107369 / LMG 19739 / B1) TaxID=886377 RepID=G2PLB6_ALLRU|nr:hypothetical protein [Allomuricauda ruestringensis]AEM72173.1 hypothetical protein Murru_3152 [Allomuricauda ruestringensis DSM 13258]
MEHITQNSIKQNQELLMRVERNQRMVQRLSEKLNSYIYEPKCPRRFEKFYELNRSIQSFTRHQKQVMSKIKSRRIDLTDAKINEIEDHLNRFKKLESEFASYIFDLNKPL